MRHLLNKQGILDQMNTGYNKTVEYHKGGGNRPVTPNPPNQFPPKVGMGVGDSQAGMPVNNDGFNRGLAQVGVAPEKIQPQLQPYTPPTPPSATTSPTAGGGKGGGVGGQPSGDDIARGVAKGVFDGIFKKDDSGFTRSSGGK